MSSIVIFVLGAVALVLFIVSIWYLFQTIRVMWSYSSLLAIAAIIFSPFVHIIFYLIPKDSFDKYEKGLFRRYFLSIGALVVLGVVASVLIPAIEQNQFETMVSDVDASQPWDWDIRAENHDETLAQTEVDSSDVTKAEALHYEAIYQTHPDADKIIDSPEYALWLQEKTPEEQNNIAGILREGTAIEVIYVLSNFKKDLENHRANDYQARRENAQALAQSDYQEKQSRELETIKANNQRSHDQQQQYQQQLSARAAQPAVQAAPSKRELSYDERMEREKTKALISKPIEGARGLTASQRQQLVALESD